MIDKYGKKGFSVINITDGPEAETKKFIEDAKLKSDVVFEKPLKSMQALGFEGYPSAALVAPNGKVVWTGHPGGLTDKIVEEHLAGVTLAPASDKLVIECELPKKLASAQKLLATGKLGEGRNAVATALAAKDLKDEDKAKLEEAAAAVDQLVEAEMKAADEALASKRCHDAQVAWKRVSAQCRGLDAAKTADQKLLALSKDPGLKKELEAGGRIAEAQKLAAAGKVKPAIAILQSLGQGYLKETEEAKRAATLLEEMKKAE